MAAKTSRRTSVRWHVTRCPPQEPQYLLCDSSFSEGRDLGFAGWTTRPGAARLGAAAQDFRDTLDHDVDGAAEAASPMDHITVPIVLIYLPTSRTRGIVVVRGVAASAAAAQRGQRNDDKDDCSDTLRLPGRLHPDELRTLPTLLDQRAVGASTAS